MLSRAFFISILIAAALAGAACRHNNAKDVVRNALVGKIGNDAVDCGWSAIGSNRMNQQNCVLDAFRNHRAFIALSEVQGKEAPYVLGLAQDGRGDAYTILIESGDNFQSIYEDATKAGKQLTPTPCPSPTKLRIAADGYVTCSSK